MRTRIVAVPPDRRHTRAGLGLRLCQSSHAAWSALPFAILGHAMEHVVLGDQIPDSRPLPEET